MSGRQKNVDWSAPADGTISVNQAALQTLCDIRDELQAIRHQIECSNVSRGFVAMASLERHVKRRFPNKRQSKGNSR